MSDSSKYKDALAHTTLMWLDSEESAEVLAKCEELVVLDPKKVILEEYPELILKYTGIDIGGF